MNEEAQTALLKEILDFVARVKDAQLDEDRIDDIIETINAEFIVSKDALKLALLTATERAVEALEKAIKTGRIPAPWDNPEAKGKLITVGLDRYDPRVALQAAVRSTYSAGRYERAMKAPSISHFIYRTIGDARVRDSHRRINGFAAPKTDPVWNTLFPPNGWRCRCRAYAIDEQGIESLKAAGVEVQTKPLAEKTIEETVEKAWRFNPANEPQELKQKLAERLIPR